MNEAPTPSTAEPKESGADPALVASPSSPQAVSTEGFDPGEVAAVAAKLIDPEKKLLLGECDDRWDSWMWAAAAYMVSLGLGTRQGGNIQFDTPLAAAVAAHLRDSGRHPEGENSRSEVESEACQSGGEAASPNLGGTAVEQRAREMLAAEYDRDGLPEYAEHFRKGLDIPSMDTGRVIRAITKALQSTDEVVQVLERVVDAARKMPRRTPKAGGASTAHVFHIEAHAVWALDRALTELAKLKGQSE